MSEVEAKALVSKVDKDGSKGVDFTEFAQLWEALHGEAEVYTDRLNNHHIPWMKLVNKG